MKANSKIYIAGHKGMLGSAIYRRLRQEGYKNLLTRPKRLLDLRNQCATRTWLYETMPEYIFIAAAKVGGIQGNIDSPVRFIYDNLMIAANVIHYAAKLKTTKKLLFLSSACTYPKVCVQPLKEEYMLTGPMEPSNEPYAIAKIAGQKLCEAYRKERGKDFITVLPTNLYGPGDNYNLRSSHVIPALLRKIYEAKLNNEPQVTIWGSGNPTREFLHANDAADGCLFLMKHYSSNEAINLGVGEDISIGDLALLVKEIIGYEGQLIFDTFKPDGVPKRQLDVTRMDDLGWKPKIGLEEGLRNAFEYMKRELKLG